MTDREARLESRLTAFFEAEEPPAQDKAFEGRVMQRIAARRLLDAVFEWATPFVVGVAILWALWPALLRMSVGAVEAAGLLAPLGLAAVIAGASYWAAMRLRLVPPVELTV